MAFSRGHMAWFFLEGGMVFLGWVHGLHGFMWVYMARYGFKVSVSNLRSDLLLRPYLTNIGSYACSQPSSANC